MANDINYDDVKSLTGDDWKDLGRRAAWTFAQSFIGFAGLLLSGLGGGGVTLDPDTLKATLFVTAGSGLAAAVSAVKSYFLTRRAKAAEAAAGQP